MSYGIMATKYNYNLGFSGGSESVDIMYRWVYVDQEGIFHRNFNYNASAV